MAIGRFVRFNKFVHASIKSKLPYEAVSSSQHETAALLGHRQKLPETEGGHQILSILHSQISAPERGLKLNMSLRVNHKGANLHWRCNFFHSRPVGVTSPCICFSWAMSADFSAVRNFERSPDNIQNV